jgi:hypothetical protein
MSVTPIDKVLFTAKAHTTGGRREGHPAPPMATWMLSFRFLEQPAPGPTPSSYSRSDGRPASCRRSKSSQPE